MEEQVIIFEKGRNGKPQLSKSGLSFNLSHSATLIATYFSTRGEVGCDIQACKVRYSTNEIAKECFNSAEIELSGRVEDGFFAIWAMKEAMIKQRGGTLSDLPSSDITPHLEDFNLYSLSDGVFKYFLALYPGSEELAISSPLPLKEVLSDMLH